MFAEVAPETVRNFLNLTAIGALNETTFSRVVPGFVIQGGNLYTNEKLSDEMKWRAQRTIPDEPSAIKHERGIISMARSEEPNSATTSFFILLRETSTLDGKFAAFGRVINGMETVEEINKMKVENEKPENPVRIKKGTIFPCKAEHTVSIL
jgi:peptidyl-prolyl cis-trans isomerase B (cyclophilin B)